MLIQKVYRAFGYIITKTEFEVGDTLTENVGYCVANRFKVDKDTNFNLTKEDVNEKEYNHIWLITRGKVDCEVEETGFKYSRGPGFCTLIDGNPFGTIQGNIVEGLDQEVPLGGAEHAGGHVVQILHVLQDIALNEANVNRIQ